MPESPVPVGAAGTSESPAAGPPADSPVRVLIADDNLDDTETMALFLQTLGYEVETANDGVGAVEIASRFRPDVALIDVTLPGLDGYTVATRLRAVSGLGGVALVSMAERDRAVDPARSRASGFSAHLQHPIAPDVLQRLLFALRTGQRRRS
jgi:CheY-like chemotaxis protein